MKPGSRVWLGLLTLLAAALLLAWIGLRSGPDPTPPAATATPTATHPPQPGPEPEPTLSLMPPDPGQVTGFAELTRELGGRYALAWVDGAGLHVLGTPADETAWSTMKVPLAVAALNQQPSASEPLVERAIAVSDNDAALALWRGLGEPEDAARAVDEVLAAYGSTGTRTESREVRPPFSPFGQTVWNLADQARFARELACVTGDSSAGQVRAAMGRIIPDHRWGIGRLDDTYVKGGWGPGEDGAYVVRQFGDAAVADDRYALAGSARARAGSYAQGVADLDQVIDWWLATIQPDSAGLTCD